MVRRGAYLRRLNGVESFVDSTSVTLLRPGDEMQVAHPLGCGDLFTIVELSAGLVDELALCHGDFALDDKLDLAHRSLIAAALRGTDSLEIAERVAAILDRLPAQSPRDLIPGHPSHQRLVSGAKQLLASEGLTLSLDAIALRLNCSPHHLSRVFRRLTGETMTAYRNRFRVRQVLADLQDGERRLRDLAARYGFADQAHMIRVVRRHAGDSPSVLREALRA